MGFEVTQAADGRTAIKRLDESRPTLLCIDLMLPESSGYDVCEHVHKTPTLKGLPIVMVSARTMPEDRAQAEELGVRVYLVQALHPGRAQAGRRPGPRGHHPVSDPRPVPRGTEPELFDTRSIRQVLGFVFRGVRRHRAALGGRLPGRCWCSAWLAAVLLPRTYHAESRLLANNNDLIRALGNPRSSLPSEDPTRAARELIFAHDNMVSLIKQTNLMKNWEETRPPAGEV